MQQQVAGRLVLSILICEIKRWNSTGLRDLQDSLQSSDNPFILAER